MRILFLLLFSIIFSLNSYAKWVKTGVNSFGDTDYIDIERIKKIDGHIYYWILIDYPNPTEWGDMSATISMKGDCELNRVKYLSFIYSKKSMGEGKKELSSPSQPKWKFLTPGSGAEYQLKLMCQLFE